MDDYTGAIRNSGSNQAVDFGLGTIYQWEQAPDGLGIPAPEFEDVELPGQGMYAGMDRLRRRIIRVPIVIVVDQDLETELDVLKSAWRPSDITKELDLQFNNNGRRYFGRARGLDVDLTNISQGVITAVGTFEASDPFGYELSTESASPTGSSVYIENAGTAPTTRCVLTITGNGGKPYLENVDDPHGGFIRFRENLSNGTVVTINLENFRIRQGTTARDSMLSADTTFFSIYPIGDTGNRITFSGCSSVSAVSRAAYL